MAHHSGGGWQGFTKEEADEIFGLGPTGKFPRGKLTENDEGELRIAVGSRNGAVVMDFGKPTSWIGFTPEQADQIADSLREHARSLRGE